METRKAEVDWLRVPIDPDLLNKLNTTSNFRGFLQAGTHLLLWAITACTAWYVWFIESWWWLVPALLLNGVMQTMLGSGVHELVHERVFSSKFLNRFFLFVNSFLSGWNYPFFILSHKDHHRFTLNQPHDLEVVQPNPEDLAKAVPATGFKKFWNKFKMYFGFIFNIWGIKGHFKLHWILATGSHPKDGSKVGLWSEVWCEKLFSRFTDQDKKEIRNYSRIYLAGHAIIIIASLATGQWMIPIIVCLGNFTGGWVGFLTGGPQHAGLQDNVNDFRLSCRTYTCNKFFQFLYWNMNYHIEHHMYAAVPCYNLPKLHEAVKEYLPPCHNNLMDTWSEIRGIEQKQKDDPHYQFVQALPELQPGNEHLKDKIIKLEDKSALAYLDLAPIEITASDEELKIWECEICGYIYDEELGDANEGFAPGTRWSDIPDDWICPDCAVSKSEFKMIERSRVPA
ncbi:MAG: fatty acid desaturase [Lentisphaeria bacterium]|nr:fatty acid desaturase [Lentisphaeria bacterium]NQZ70844.1 fatty acid desaturase [Lentisphaeria bacterium]